MSSAMTRLRWVLVVGLLGARVAVARQQSLFTSAVTYCAPPESILVQELDIRYFKENTSVVFDVTASSLRSDLKVALALNLTVYGMQPLSLDLNLCNLASAICPLPLYNFSGFGTLPLPSSFSSKIPTIGYSVPDLEAFAQLELIRVDTGEVAACVSATLSNGWSMRQVGATWGAVGVVLLSIVGSALWAMSRAKWSAVGEVGMWAEKEAWRVVDVIIFIQSIAVSALLNLNYPSAYRAFSLNFPFSLLLNGPLPSQTAIDNLRGRTGARLSDDSLPADEYVNRRLSPYNQGQNFALGSGFPITQSVDLGAGAGYTVSSVNSTGLVAKVADVAKRAFINPATVTPENALAAGIPVYVNGAGVATANAFLGVFFEWLVIGAAVLFVFLAYVIWRRWGRTRSASEGEKVGRRGMSRTSRMLHGMALRLALILVLPVSVFSMFQWTLRDSWLATLLSVLCILTTWAGVFWAWTTVAFDSHVSNEGAGRWAALKSTAPTMALYTIPPFILALFVAFASRSGTAQVSALVALETLSLIFAIVIRRRTRRSERDILLNSPASPAAVSTPSLPPPTRMSITLRVLRVLASGLMIPFLERLSVRAIPRTVIGIVAAAVWSLGVVFAFGCVVWGLVKLARRKRAGGEVVREDGRGIEEEGTREK
ncbi:hypothetical protein BDV93DRAFT_478550, partial [Ceratobasidium sp. AG-I]